MKYVFRGIMYVTRGIGERRKVGNVGCSLSTYDRRTAQRDNERIVDGLSMRRPAGERRGLSFA